MKYYFLVSYLPELTQEDKKLRLRLADLLAEKEQFDPGDWREIELVLLGGDVVILERLLAGKSPQVEHSLYRPDFWKEQIKTPKEGPEFLLEFLQSLSSGLFGPEETKRLYGAYYAYVLENSANEALKEYIAFERDLRNILAAIRARRRGLSPAAQLVGESDVVEVLARSSAEDFGLSRDYPFVERLLAAKDPLVMEAEIERILWGRLDEMAGGDVFDFETILAYLLKLQLLEKRLSLSHQEGLETIRRLEGA